MRKFSFCGLFATVFVTTTIILLASCSQDDDYYESDMYTLAEMETRSGGGDPGGEWYEITAGADICDVIVPHLPFNLRYSLTWGPGQLSSVTANVSFVTHNFTETNDTVILKSPSGEISRGPRYIYVGEQRPKNTANIQEWHFVLDGIVVYYKCARKNSDSITYSYHDEDEYVLTSLSYPIPSSYFNY